MGGGTVSRTVVKWRLSRIKTLSDGFSVHLMASGAIVAKLLGWGRPEFVSKSPLHSSAGCNKCIELASVSRS